MNITSVTFKMDEGHISSSDNDMPPNDDIESELDDYIPAVSDIKNIEQLAQISSEGVTAHELALLNLNSSDLNLKQCTFCNKFFKQDMIIPDFDVHKNPVDEIQCWHCIFWMNYPISARKNVDGIFGMTIVDYILKCKDIHEMSSCTRNSDSGGCFLCEHNLGLPLTDVKDLNKLYGFFEPPLDPIEDIEDRIEIDSLYKADQIVVEI